MASSGGFCRSGWIAVSRLASVIIFFLFAFPLMGLNFADSLLVTRQEPRKADVIVVLGGEHKGRVEKTAALYKRGFAPRILVTGKNEDKLIGRSLVAAGVPESAIWLEPAAESTFENATFTAPILEQWNAKKVLLVTSWFHSRRAASVFQGISGTIDFLSIPTDNVSIECLKKDKWLRGHVLMEYLKIAGYWVRYGILPLLG